MDIQTLRQNLKIQDGSVTIGAGTVTTDKYAVFFRTVLENTALLVRNARPGPDDGGNTVQIEGNASTFRRVDGAPILATFVLDPNSGDVRVDLRFTLLDGRTTWKFSKSFPDLPTTFDFSTGLADPQTSPLDDLPLSAAWFHALTDDSTVTVDLGGGKSKTLVLDAGLGFAGIVQLGGLVMALEYLLSADTRFVIGGNIVPPPPVAQPLPEGVNKFPWTVHESPPGITLTADLGLDVSISDKLKLEKTTFSVYSPLTVQWWAANPTYAPFTAISGSLFIPSANLRVDLSSKVPKGMNRLVITEEFSGFSLANLADLLDLAGTATLIDTLPEQLKDGAHALGNLQLLDAAIAFSGTRTGISVEYVYITVGMPDAKWKLADGFTFESLAVEFYVTTPFQKPGVGATVQARFKIGDTPVRITSGYPDFFVTGELEDSVTLPLKTLIQTYVPEIAPPTDLTIDALAVNVQPKVGFNFYTQMAKAPGWVIPLGPHSLTILDVSFGVARSFGPNPQTSAQIAGGLVFDDSLTLAMAYDPTQGFTMRGSFPEVTLNGLIKWLCNADNVLPAGFGDLAFTGSTLMITKTADQFQLSFGTQIATAGSFAFVLQQQGGQWGFAVGLDLNLSKLSTLPGMSGIQPFLDIFPITGEQVIIVSTLQKSDFNFPALSLFDNPNITSPVIPIPKWSGGLQKGFYFYAQTCLNNNRTLQNLADMLGIPRETSLEAGIYIGSNAGTDARLFANISTVVSTSLTLAGQLGIRWQNELIEFYMVGTAHTVIQNQPVRFDVGLAVMENGAFLSGDMVVEGGRNTIDFSVFKLQHLAVALGISFEGIPSLGFSAALDIADVDSAVALFIDTSDPARSMVAGAVSDITLAKVVDELSGAKDELPDFLRPILEKVGLGGLHSFTADLATYKDALDNYRLDDIRKMFVAGSVELPASSGQIQLIVNQPGRLWYLLDLSNMYHYELVANGTSIDVSLEAQLYVVPEPVNVASLTFQQGFHVFAAIDFLLLQETISVEVMPTKGIGCHVEISQIVIGSDKLFKLSGAGGTGGPKLLLCTFTDAKNPDPAFRVPAFRVSGEAYILGINPEVDIDINADHCHFELKDCTLFGSVFTLKADIGGLDAIAADGSAKVGIDKTIDFGVLGSISIDDTINAGLGFGTRKDGLYAHADFSFTLAGHTYSVVSFDLSIDTGPLADLPGIILQKIKEFLEALFKDVKAWLEYAWKGIVKGFEDVIAVGRVLLDHFKVAWKEAAILMHAVGYAAEEVLKVLVHVFEVAEEEAEKAVDFLFQVIKDCAMTGGLLAA